MIKHPLDGHVDLSHVAFYEINYEWKYASSKNDCHDSELGTPDIILCLMIPGDTSSSTFAAEILNFLKLSAI